MAMKTLSCDILIGGAGLVGGPLAVALAAHGLSVAVVDRRDPLALNTPDGRSAALALAPKRLFDAIGLWERVAPAAAEIRRIHVSDGPSPLTLSYDYRMLGDEPLGWIIENHHLLDAIGRAMAGHPAIRILTPRSVARLEQHGGGVEALLDDGTRVAAALAVAADGRASLLRTQAGIGVKTLDYGQTAIVCAIAHARAHGNVAHERFLPAGPFAILPLPGRRSSIVWTERSAVARGIMQGGERLFHAELAERIGGFLGAIAVEGKPGAFPLGASWARAAGAGRLLLAGDSLHGLHPVAGQGMNMGLRDVAALTEAVVEARRLGLDIGSALVGQRYARWRRLDNLMMLGMTDGLVRLFSNRNPVLTLARDLGLAAVERSGPAKRFFMRHAMGVVGALPRLLKGEAI